MDADDKYPVLNNYNLTMPIQMQLPQKQNSFSQFLPQFLKSSLNFKIVSKKITLIDLLFPKLWPQKTWLDKCLKIPLGEDPSTSNMVNMPKNCWNLRHSTFIKLIDHCQVRWVGKSLSYWHGKSWDCLLTHWLPMKSILFLIETI